MALKQFSSLPFVFLVVATIVLAENATAAFVDLCKDAEYQPLCRSTIKGISDAGRATEVAINALLTETKRVREVAKRLGKSDELDICNDNLGYATEILKTALKNLKDRDKNALSSNLSGALSDYVTCDDAYSESGKTSPLANNTKILRNLASNCAALANQVL